MDLNYRQTYNGTPDRVAALMRHEPFIKDVAEHAGALAHTVTIEGDTTRLQMKMPVPSALTKFVGESVDLEQAFTWGEPDANGVRPGRIEVRVPRMPVNVNVEGKLNPTADGGSEARVDGDLKVNIPLIGKKVESQIEPFIRKAFDGLERRAQVWLARDDWA